MTDIARTEHNSTASDPAVLLIRGLNVSMVRNDHRTPILQDIDLRINAGEIVSIVGRSGSGKSTLAHVINGLLPQESLPVVGGSIRVAGKEIVGATDVELRVVRKALVQVIAQDPLDSLNPTMIVRRQLVEACNIHVARERLRWAGIVDLARIMQSFPHQLSGGERQRVLIAMATVADVPLIVADEPTTGLDPHNKKRVIALLRELASQGTAVMINTHDLSLAEASDRMAVLDSGVLVETGKTSELMTKPIHRATASLLAARYDIPSSRPRIPSKPKTRQVSYRGDLDESGVEKSSEFSFPTDARSIVLNMSRVAKTFPTRHFFHSKSVTALSSIDLTVSAGECVGLIGDSGAGKSTLLKIAAGIMKPDSGLVTRCRKDDVQMVFQDPKSFLTPWIPIGEQITEGLRSRSVSARARQYKLSEMMDFVGLERPQAEALPGELSVGQCQRAVIARALAVSPHLLLCDEPISALDTVLAASTLSLFQEIRRAFGTAIVLATHDHAAANVVADRVYSLRDGKLCGLEGDASRCESLHQVKNLPC